MAETGKAPPGQLLKILAKTTAELFEAAPLEVSLLAAVLVAQASVPVLTLHLTRLTVDGVAALSRGGGISVFALTVWWTLTLLIDVLLSPVGQAVRGNVAERFTAHVNLALIQKSETLLGLELLEDSRFYDDLEVLQKNAAFRPLNILVTLVYTGRDLLALVGVSLLLVSVGWWVPLAAVVSAYPLARTTLKFRELSWGVTLNRTPEARAMAYETGVALTHTYAAEVRLFNLLPWLRRRYEGAFGTAHRAMRRVRKDELLAVLPRSLLSLAVVAGIFAWSLVQAAAGQLSAGEVAVVISGLTTLQNRVLGLVESVGLIFSHMLYFQKYFDFLAAEPQVKNPERPAPLPATTPHIRFEHVSFHYPDGRTALQDVSFELRPGETVAVVGENGAGKTTLVKLLLRFYDPTEGSVTLGGVNLRDVDLHAWRKRVSAVFQDFGRYAYTV